MFPSHSERSLSPGYGWHKMSSPKDPAGGLSSCSQVRVVSQGCGCRCCQCSWDVGTKWVTIFSPPLPSSFEPSRAEISGDKWRDVKATSQMVQKSHIVTKVRRSGYLGNGGGDYLLEKAWGSFLRCWKSPTSSSVRSLQSVYIYKKSLSSSWQFSSCILLYSIISQWTIVQPKRQVGDDPSSFHFILCLTHFILETVRVLSISIHYTSLSSSTSMFISTGYIYICNQIYIFKSGEKRKVLYAMSIYRVVYFFQRTGGP